MHCPFCGLDQACSCVERIKEEIKQRIHLPDLIAQDFGGGRKVTGRGRQYYAPCPFHGSRDKDLSIFIGRDGHWVYRCHGASCGATGDAISYVMQRQGIEYLQALEQLGGRRMLSLPPIKHREPPREPTKATLDLALAMSYHAQVLGSPEHQNWWHEQGINDQSIHRYKLGYCLACPLMQRSPSYTIPISDHDCLRNIRHRLLNPPSSGDKYRPQAPGLGAQLFNVDSLSLLPDGSPRRDKKQAAILEGEKKVIVVGQTGIEWRIPLVTSTAGATSWQGELGELWYSLFDDYEEIIVLFDPGAEQAALRTARLFGQRGRIASLPEKADDLLLDYGEMGERLLIKALEQAKPTYQSYWGQFLGAGQQPGQRRHA